MNLPNPFKVAALKRIPVKTPEIYAAIEKFTKEMQEAASSRLQIGAGPSAAEKIKTTGVNTLTPNPEPIPLQYPYRETTAADRMANDFIQNSRRLFNTPQLPAGSDAIRLPSQGTPNVVGAPYAPGGNQGPVGGMSQRVSDAYNRSIAEWKSSGTKQTYDNWVNKGSSKPLFESTTQKVRGNTKYTPAQEQAFSELDTKIEMLDDVIANNPMNSLGSKTTTVMKKDAQGNYTKSYKKKVNPLSALYDKKNGGLRELGDIRNGKTSLAYEDSMREVGTDNPLEFIKKANEAIEQKNLVKNLKSFREQARKNPDMLTVREETIQQPIDNSPF